MFIRCSANRILLICVAASPATVGDDTEVSNLVAQLLRMRQDKLALQAELEMEKSQANHFREGLRKHKHAGFVRLWLKSIKTCGLSALWVGLKHICICVHAIVCIVRLKCLFVGVA